MPSDRETLGKLLRKNKRLARGLSRFEAVFNAIPSAVLVVDSDGEIEFANSFAERVLGISEPYASVFKLLTGLEDAMATLDDDGAAVMREFEISYPEPRVLSARIIPFGEEESRQTYALVLNDVTQDRRSTQERIESEKIASVLNLASGVAHELGNPLNSINIHLQLIRRRLAKSAGKIAPEILAQISESVNICSSEVSRLDGIIENFLKAVRPVRADMAQCDPLKPLAETLGTLKEELLNLKISIDVGSENSLPAVYADENLLKQLYFNVIKNAMEAMNGGGEISVSARSDDDYVKISFADSGCGMSGDEMSHLFEPYFTTKPDGHGLGMMIIRAIIRAHGGKIDVDSKRGRGTTVTVSLPRNERRVKMLPPSSH